MCHLDLNAHHLLTPKGEMFWSLLTIFILRKPPIVHSSFLNPITFSLEAKELGESHLQVWQIGHWACGPPHQHHLLPSQQHSPVYFQKTTEDQRNQMHFVIYSKKIDEIPQQGPLQPAPLAGQEASITCTAGQGTQRPRLLLPADSLSNQIFQKLLGFLLSSYFCQMIPVTCNFK